MFENTVLKHVFNIKQPCINRKVLISATSLYTQQKLNKKHR